MEPIKNPSSDLAGDAKDLANQVAGRAKGLVSDQLADTQEKSAGALDQVADALRRTREDLGDAPAAPYIARAADMVERFSGSVRTASVDRVMQSTERFARREPLLFLGGAFALGFAAARFIRSSTHQAERQDQQLLSSGGAHDDGH